MPTETTVQEWIAYARGKAVSGSRLQLQRDDCIISHSRMQHTRDDCIFTLADAAYMDVTAFNREAEVYGLHMGESDFPLQRMFKYIQLLSRMDEDKSFMPKNPQYVEMALKANAAKLAGKEPLASFYDTLTSGPCLDAVAEFLRFEERLPDGRFIVTPFGFNEHGEREQIDDRFIYAGEGWTETIGQRGYPLKVRKKRCPVQNIDAPELQGMVFGYSYLGTEPARGEQRSPLRVPFRGGDRLLNASVSVGQFHSHKHVGALRLRDVA